MGFTVEFHYTLYFQFSQISAVTPVDIGDFLFNPQLTILSLGRGVTIVFWLTLFAIPTYFFSADVWPVIRPPAPVPTNTTAAGSKLKQIILGKGAIF